MKRILIIPFILISLFGVSQRVQTYVGQIGSDTSYIKRNKTSTLVLNPQAPWTQGTGGRYDGDSYTVGQASSAADSDYVNRTALYYGLYGTRVNAGLSGSGVWSAASLMLAAVNTASPATNTLYESMMIGLNDIRRSGNNATTFRKIVNGYKSVFANLYLKNWQTANGGANVTRYGVWTAYAAQSVGGKTVATTGSFTARVNDSLTYTFTDSTVVWGGIGSDGVTNIYSNSISVYIDNVLVDTYSENLQYDGISDGVYDNKRGPVVRIYGGLTFAVHTLKLVNNTANPMVVDYVGNLLDAASTSAKPFYVWKVPYITASGYAAVPSSGSLAVTDSVNVKIDSLFAALPGYPVAVINTNYYTNTTSDMDADSIHRNNQGHRHLAEAMEATVPYYSFSNYPGTMTFFGGRWYGNDALGSRQKMAFLSDVTGAIPGIQGNVMFNNTSGLGADTRFNWNSTTHQLGIGPTGPAYDLDVNGTINGAINVGITNSSAGAGAFSQVVQFNSVGDFTRFAQYSSGLTTSGMLAAHDGSLDQSGGNLSIRVNTGNVIKFGINNVEFGRMSATGFGWGRAATTDFDVFSANATTEVRSTTSNASASSLAFFSANNSSAHALQFGIWSAATSTGIFGAEDGLIQCNNAGNLTILTTNAKAIQFAPAGAIKGRFASGGDFLLNTAVDNGALTVAGVVAPEATGTRDIGTSSFAWRSILGSGAESHGLVDVAGTGTYSALATDYTIQFTGTTATLAYPTLNLINGRHLNVVNNASGSVTIPSTKSGNAATITTLTTGQRAQVEYDLGTTTWILVSLN